MKEPMEEKRNGCASNLSTEAPDKRVSSGFKYPRRLCTQKAEKCIDIYGQRPDRHRKVSRPILSPVRTRSQSQECENSENIQPQKDVEPPNVEKMEEACNPPESPLSHNILVSTSTPKRQRASGRSEAYSCEDASILSTDENLSRSRSRLGSPSSSFSCDGSRMSSGGSERNRRRNRNRHPEYDPTIEIRQARERHNKYRSGKWSDTSDLYDAVMEDKEKYKEKLEKRARDKGQVDDHGNPEVDMEEDDDVLARRQRDIDNGKTTTEYEGYVKAIPKPLRRINQPRTPNKFIRYSRRQWDGLVRSWRRQLHTWDADNSIVDSSSFSSSFWDSPNSFYSDSNRSNRGRKSDVRVRRSYTKMDERSAKRTPLKSLEPPSSPTSSQIQTSHSILNEDEDTMMGFPSAQVETNPTLSSTPSIRKKRASGHSNSNSNSGHHGPDLESLSTGLTSDVGDVMLNVRGTPTKRKTTDDSSLDCDKQEGGTPRKRARQQCDVSNCDDQSFAQVVQMNVLRAGGSPYKLRSQMRRAPTIQEEESSSSKRTEDTFSYAEAVRGPAKKLMFNEGD